MSKTAISHVMSVRRFFRLDIRIQHQKLPLPTNFESFPTNFNFLTFLTQSVRENFVQKSTLLEVTQNLQVCVVFDAESEYQVEKIVGLTSRDL